MIAGKTADETTRFEKIGMSGTAKFRTACGRTFDSNVALAEYLGVDKSSVSHATCDAKAKGRMWFECGKPHKRCVTILTTNAASDSEKDEVCKLQSLAYNAWDKTYKNRQMQGIQASANQQSMKAMQVHTHLQAASLKLFPERKLRLLWYINRDIAVSIKQDAIENSGAIKFDVAGTWMLHDEQTDKSLVWFNKQVDVYLRNRVLCADSYASLLVCDYTPGTSQHLLGPSDDITCYRRAFLNAEDMLSFLQHHVVMFDDEQQAKTMPKEAKLEALPSPPTYQESLDVKFANIPISCSREFPPLPSSSGISCGRELSLVQSARKRTFGMAAADEFMAICDKVMQNVDEGVLQRRELLASHSNTETVKKSKTYLACDSVRNMTSILLAANKFLFAASQEF